MMMKKSFVLNIVLGAVLTVATGFPVSSVAAEPEESLFFTSGQLIEIMRANQGFIAPKAAAKKEEQGAYVDRGRRILTLSGIVYNGPSEWTVWLNGQRVTPKNIPEDVLGLTVKEDRIHLRWNDRGNQRIVNLTLRPHQQYNLDTDVVSSGT